jgi:putative ABC transport system substrate-binding protein
MRRREFISLLGGTAAAWPFAARAQQAALPVIGFLNAQSSAEYDIYLNAFRGGLGEAGYTVNRNVGIEYRWAEGRYDRLPAFAADLVRQRVAIIVATGGTPAPLAAKAATTTIPIVFNTGANPVEVGLVPSFNRPGGNITGVTFTINEIGAKRLELLHELVPQAATVGYLVNPSNPITVPEARDVQAAARALGLTVEVQNAGNEREIDAAFARFAERRVGAVLVSGDALFVNWRDQLVSLAARYAIPTGYHLPEHVAAGGLMSYGASQKDAYRQVGVYTGRVLNGEKPGDLPIVQPTKFELAINLKTAKALGLAVPQTLLVAADEVIE